MILAEHWSHFEEPLHKNVTPNSSSGVDNPFYKDIDAMPDFRPRRKSIPMVSELVRYKHNTGFARDRKRNALKERGQISGAFLFC